MDQLSRTGHRKKYELNMGIFFKCYVAAYTKVAVAVIGVVAVKVVVVVIVTDALLVVVAIVAAVV